MDLKNCKLDNFPAFYKGLFKVWGLFQQERPQSSSSLFWLLKEPVVYGIRLKCEAGPSLLRSLCEAHIFTLGQAVEVCGPHLDDAAALARCLGIRSLRVSSLLLKSWKQPLKDSEL